MSGERLIKEDLGERLFASINKLYPTMAGRITGMLLEMNNSDLLYLLDHNEPLKARGCGLGCVKFKPRYSEQVHQIPFCLLYQIILYI